MTSTPPALQLENERLQRELGQARAELEDFTYSVSHDLRASLRHVNAYVQIIREDLGDQTPAAVASHMARLAGRLALDHEAVALVSNTEVDFTVGTESTGFARWFGGDNHALHNRRCRQQFAQSVWPLGLYVWRGWHDFT